MQTGASDLSRVFARQIAAGQIELPPMPGTASEVMALCQSESTDAAKVSAVIHRDQTIASNVLRVANSAAYAGQVPCAGLQQAVSRLGMQLITEIAMAVAVRGRMFANKSCAELLAALWKHSILVGFYTKEIARLRRRNVEIAFLCGLLHDVGKAVLVNNVDKVVGNAELGLPMAELLDALDQQHVAAGELLAKEWKLPDQVAEAIRCHHDIAAAGSFADMAMTVQLADAMAYHVLPSLLATPLTEAQLRQHAVLVGLNIYPDQLDALLKLKERALMVAEGMQ